MSALNLTTIPNTVKELENELNFDTHSIDNNGDTLSVTVYPNNNKETVILLHGGPGVPDDLVEVVTLLSCGYQVVTFHQRGTKQSPCRSNDYSMKAYVSDIDTVASYFGLRTFHLFGHSWGGLYAQVYAQQNSERLLSLFLCSTGSGTNDQWKTTESEVMTFNKSKTTSAEWMVLGINSLLGMLGSDNAYRKLFKQVIINYNKGYSSSPHGINFDNVKALSINRTRKEILEYPMLTDVPSPTFKITIVYGDNDIYGGSKIFVMNRFPTAGIHNIENCGHFPWLHNPSAFRALLAGHFNSST